MVEPSLEQEIRDILEREAAAGGQGSPSPAGYELQFEKWRLIHKYIHQNPFATRARLPRSEQWREAANRIRDLGELELLDWALLQAEIAGNLERGIQDMRPRRKGPCYGLLLEYVANRKRKALAVLHFAKAGEDEGVFTVNSAFHARTENILGDSPAADDGAGGGHEDVPWEAPDEEES